MDMARPKETPATATGRASAVKTAGGKPLGAIERACRFIEARVADGERFTLAELGASSAASWG
jgi:hypothetical protein